MLRNFSRSNVGIDLGGNPADAVLGEGSDHHIGIAVLIPDTDIQPPVMLDIERLAYRSAAGDAPSNFSPWDDRSGTFSVLFSREPSHASICS
jgi:hypothetical protein